MRKGETINGYRILRDFTTAGGGLGMWTFAEKGGVEYFIKQFLAPTYPADAGPGSERTKQRKRERCRAFEAHHRRLMKATREVAGKGLLVVTSDFFRSGANYYKVTEKVDIAGLDLAEIARLPIRDRFTILLTVAASLTALHSKAIVHGDLKAENVMIRRTSTSFAARLIDFDSSFFSGEPSPSEDIVGTFAYYSPELLAYVLELDGAEPRSLTLKADVFALGLVFSEYLTGTKPAFDGEKYSYACEAVRAGSDLRPHAKDLPSGLADLLARMLRRSPDERPTVFEVQQGLKEVQRTLSGGSPPEPAPPAPDSRPEPTPTPVPEPASSPEGRLKIKRGAKKPSSSGEGDPPPDSSKTGGRLKGRLLGGKG